MRPDTPQVVDALIERVSRAAAARTTRRGFLARAGALAVVVAGGPALAGSLRPALGVGPSDGRVCGQSGTSPTCATFDCDGRWGWCWYASGCCANGALKKICDCCAPNQPNPRGYCPAGTEVKCIVESCGHDPRLQTVELAEVTAAGLPAATAATARARFAGAVPMAVIGDAEHDRFAALAASAGRVVDGPVLLSARDGLSRDVADVVSDLGVEYARVVGPRLSAAVDDDLAALGVAVERVGDAADPAGCAAQVAGWQRELTGARTAVVVLDDAPGDALGAAAALAHARRLPLLFGDGDATRRALATPRATRRTYVVTADADRASAFPGGQALTGGDAAAVSAAVAVAARAAGVPGDHVAVAPAGQRAAQLAAATLASPVVLHAGDEVGEATFAFLLDARGHLDAVTVVGDAALASDVRWQLQAVVNEFEAHALTGSAGQGLPVIPQPHDERPVGAIPY